MKLPDLPVYYYLDHFEEMLAFVEKTYGSILTDEHTAFIAKFNGFSRDARCLLIRMINRRGTIFNRTLFRYREIADIERAIEELALHGHARGLIEGDYAAFLACQSKDGLVAGAKAANLPDVRTSWPKPRLIEHFLAAVPFATAFTHCGGDRFVSLHDIGAVEFLLYLYFGKTEDDLKNFALRDLGVRRYRPSGA